MKHVTVFETADEVIRAFRTVRAYVSDDDRQERREKDPSIPKSVYLVLSPGSSPYFTGEGSELFDLADNITWNDIFKAALDKVEVRFEGLL